MTLAKELDELAHELRGFQCRPPTLVPDLVMIAMATDVLESAMAVRDTLESALPHKAYANARLAFEGAQQLLVLSTHEEYEAAGALAWVYFESKGARWRCEMERQRLEGAEVVTAEGWLQQRVDEMAAAWESASPGRGATLLRALKVVRQHAKKRPDNWLHENMAARQHRAYTIFAAQTGGSSGDTAGLNRGIYRALCRETHARPRLVSFVIIHNASKDMLRIDVAPRDADRARRAVAASTDEAREIIIGQSHRHRLLLVSFTERVPKVRIISARKATKRGRQDYEQSAKAKFQKRS